MLHPCDKNLYDVPELTTFQKLMGYTQAKPPPSESGAPSDNDTLSGLLRRALCMALQSEVPSATAAAAESILVLVQNAQWRQWLMSGRGATSPTKILTMLMSKAEALPQKVPACPRTLRTQLNQHQDAVSPRRLSGSQTSFAFSEIDQGASHPARCTRDASWDCCFLCIVHYGKPTKQVTSEPCWL